jgi:hypothetical protein
MLLKVQSKLWISRIALVGGLMLLTACSQSVHEEDALLSGDEPVPKDTKYPDFSKPLTSAMDQMTNEEAQKQEAQLAALGARRRSGAISQAEYWRRVNEMRKLKAEMPTKPAT